MIKKISAELVGTFLLVFIGTGSVAIAQVYNIENPAFFIGIGFGIAVLLPILVFGNISGAHLNPAVSIVFYLKKQLDLKLLFIYILAQSIGAILGSFMVRILFSTLFIGLTQPSGSYLESFLLEFGLTFILVLVILQATSVQRFKKYAPYLIALTVALEAYFFGSICGASMNPARSFGPAFILQNFQQLELYIIAPILGGVCSLLIFKFKN